MNSLGRIPLSEDDQNLIDELVAGGVTETEIGRRIGRSNATVAWYLYRSGQKAAAPAPEVGAIHVRQDGRMLRRWCRAEEEFALAMRKQSHGHVAISKAIKDRFGWDRTPHSIKVRMVMVAARDDAP